jgi:hypothetical protein
VYRVDRRVLQPPTTARSAIIRVAKGAAAANRVAIDRIEFNELDESLQAAAMTVR